MSIFSKLGIRFDGHTIGNLMKNVSPAAAFVPGLGLPITAALAAGGEALRGKTGLADLAKAAGSNVAIGAGARGVAGHFGVLGQGGAPPVNAPLAHAGPSIEGAPISSAPNLTGGSNATVGGLPPMANTVSHAGLPMSPTPNLTSAGASYQAPGALSRLASGAGDLAEGALSHDKTTAAVLGGLGNLGSMGAKNRAENAQAKLLEQQAGEGEYDFNQRKARDLAMEPLRQALLGKLATNFGGTNSVAPDPYGITPHTSAYPGGA